MEADRDNCAGIHRRCHIRVLAPRPHQRADAVACCKVGWAEAHVPEAAGSTKLLEGLVGQEALHSSGPSTRTCGLKGIG
eukprot:2777009-Alexandrium_andersonii.AAC.1